MQLGLLVLQHPGLGADPRVQVQGGFLIACTSNRVDELLQGREPIAGRGQRLMRHGLQQRDGLPPDCTCRFAAGDRPASCCVDRIALELSAVLKSADNAG